MKEAIWSVDPIRGIGHRDPRDPDQQMLEIELRPQTAPLRRLILDHLAGLPERQASLDDLRSFVLEQTIYKPMHATAVVRDLVTANDLRLETPGRLKGSSMIHLVATPMF